VKVEKYKETPAGQTADRARGGQGVFEKIGREKEKKGKNDHVAKKGKKSG